MKKLTSVLLVLVMLLLPLVSCTKAPEEPVPVLSSEVSDASEVLSSEVSSEVAKTLPAYTTLVGTPHLPPIGNQGGIGSCTSFGVTYMQFNIAVSQYLHSISPNTRWDPSSGDSRYIFSPKFTYVLAGPSTESCYNVLMDHGCMTKKKTDFANPRSPALYAGGDRFAAESTRWDVKEGDLESALKYRVKNFYEIENNPMQLTTSTTLMEKVKSAIAAGNGVAICGWSSYWDYHRIDDEGLGNLGKKNEYCIYAAKNLDAIYTGGDHSGNHCVCLVGYDDDITCTVGGVTLKGAFLMANSWGSGWMNDGFVWMMYDAFNTKSDYPELNYDQILNGASGMSIGELGAKFWNGIDAKESVRLHFTPIADGFVEVGGKNYPTYTVSDANDKYFLGYGEKGDGYSLTVVGDAGENTAWAMIPYADVLEWNETKKLGIRKKDNYEGGYLLYAVSQKPAETLADAFFLSGGSYKTAGRPALLSPLKDNSGLDDIVMMTVNEPGDTPFYSYLIQAWTASAKPAPRSGVIYRFSFLYWDKDIAVGNPDVMIELELENYKREGIKIVISRTDATGNTVSKSPAVYGENARNINGLFSDTSMSFGGQKADGVTYEKAYITVGFNELADLMDGYGIENFLWSISYKSLGTRLLSVSLKDADGNILQKIIPTEKDRTLDKGEEVSFLFDLGGELKEYSASPDGDRRIINQSDGGYLTFRKMLLASAKTVDPEVNDFTLTKNSDTGEVQIFKKGDNYLLDIAGKEVKDGATVKMNAPSGKRDTQGWGIRDNRDGSYSIYLARYPEYFICLDPAFGYCLTSKDTDAANCRFTFEGIDSGLSSTITGKQNGKTLEITGIAPAKPGKTLSVALISGETGETVAEKTVTAADGSFTTTLDTPAAGTYLLCAMKDGIAYGTQYVFTVK